MCLLEYYRKLNHIVPKLHRLWSNPLHTYAHNKYSIYLRTIFLGIPIIIVFESLHFILAPGSFNCQFDYGPCGWTQDKSDVFDWTKRSGGTDTTGTGPKGDHTSGCKYYSYNSFRSHLWTHFTDNWLIMSHNHHFSKDWKILEKTIFYDLVLLYCFRCCNAKYFLQNLVFIYFTARKKGGIYLCIFIYSFSAGAYYYIESSSPRRINDTARFISPIQIASASSTPYCVTFWYQMYGSHVNMLNVYLKYGSNLGSPIFTKQGSQGQPWKQGQVTIQPRAPYNVSRLK